MRLRAFVVVLFSLVAIGCSLETSTKCSGEYTPDDPRCAMAYCRAHASDPRCAELDAGASPSSDPSVDAGCPGCPECTHADECADQPEGRVHCASSGQCVACETSEHCTTREAPRCEDARCLPCAAAEHCAKFPATPVCGPLGSCVECNVHADCTDAARPVCDPDSHTCRGCASDAECASSDRVCRELTGECVECEPDRDEPAAEHCANGRACSPTTFTCTGQPRRSLGLCGLSRDPQVGVVRCISDSECTAGRRCVMTEFPRNTPYGAFCLSQIGSGPCPKQTPAKRVATSRLGVTDSYCFPNDLFTTCAGLNDYKKPCAASTECGEEGAEDGLCEGQRCTYGCDSHADCSGLCIDTGGARFCDPN